MVSHAAKHAMPGKSLRIKDMICKCVRKYAAAHKPVHYAVAGFIFGCEIVAVFATHEILVHLGLSTAITTWEMIVITIAESE